MQNDNDADQPITPDQPEPAYQTGYARPPSAHQFKPNQSGNPKGRPKGARGFKQERDEVLAMRVPMKGQKRSVSNRKAQLLKLSESGLKGNVRANMEIVRMADAQAAEAEACEGERQSKAVEEEDLALIEAALKRQAKPE